MPLDAGLLNQAKAAEGRAIDAEYHAVFARAEFHQAVRLVQLAGASLREIADALGLSHQRVHQIVAGAGGSLALAAPPDHRRGASILLVLRPGPNTGEDACRWPGSLRLRRMHQPGARRAGDGEGDRHSGGDHPPGPRRGHGRTVRLVREAPLRGRGDGIGGHDGICAECLRLCQEIMDEPA